MNVKQSLTELIGNTPILRLNHYERECGLNAALVAKLEFMNPAGSVKDRVARSMIEAAEKSGALKQGAVIIEPTSGNTGIGLAALGAAKGYRVILTMPETMSVERRKLLEAYGAEIVLTDGKKGMSGAIEKAQELHATVAGSFLAGQFENPANPAAHYATTGREIWEDTEGDLDFFVAGVGTGGTLSGAGKFLKEKIPHLKIIAVEPRGSAVLSGKAAGMHGLQGIGAGFIPATLDTAIYDEVIPTSEEDAFKACRALAKTEGVLAGISSGAALHAAATIARRSENAGKKIAVVFPDGGDRYLSTDLFS